MLGRTVPSEEIGEHLENVVSSSLSTDLDRQTLPRVLVEHGQKLQRTAVMGPRAYEVVGPHVILVQWPEPDARAIVEPQPTPFRLPSGHFQPLLPPDTLTRLWFTSQPSIRSRFVIWRYPYLPNRLANRITSVRSASPSPGSFFTRRNLSTTMGHSTGLIREQCPVW